VSITKSTRHHKIIGNFGEAFLCNWLSRSGFEVTIVDHTGLDIVAYHPATTRRLGITVKSRTRSLGSETTSVTVFSYRKGKDDRKKLLDACTAFGCEPWVALYVETDKSADLYLTSLEHFDATYRSHVAKSQDTWKMGKLLTKQYSQDPRIWHVSVSFESSTWGWSALAADGTGERRDSG
jgi:hypothetical protein